MTGHARQTTAAEHILPAAAAHREEDGASAMPLVPALDVLQALRTDQVVIATMGAAREWPKLSAHPLDLIYVPSAMGHGPMLGLGLALARPERETIVLNGDGCMLMGLGCLVTVAAAGVRNYTLVVLENSIYEVTGGQATAGAIAPVDFAGIARAAGFPNVAAFSDLDDWRQSAARILAAQGPRFVVLKVAPVGPEFQLPRVPPIRERLRAFRQALLVSAR